MTWSDLRRTAAAWRALAFAAKIEGACRIDLVAGERCPSDTGKACQRPAPPKVRPLATPGVPPRRGPGINALIALPTPIERHHP